MSHIKEEFVDIFDTNAESESNVVQGLLESNGFEVLKTMQEAPGGVLPFSNAPLGGIRLQVFESQADEARNVIAEYLKKGSPTSEETEV
jgi:hypothetical protein